MNQRKRISPHRQDSRRERQQGGQRREANAALRSLQEAAGNRALSEAFNGVIQRYPTSSNVIQRGLLGDIVTRVRVAVGDESAITETAERLNDSLQNAQRTIRVAEGVVGDPQARRRLREARTALGRVTGPLQTALDIRSNIGRVLEAISAAQELNNIDVAQNPDQAARAFGRMFVAVGNLGDLLPSGPWSGYFELLKGAGDFFVNMRSLLDPGIRWRRQFEEIEREGAYTNQRGVQRAPADSAPFTLEEEHAARIQRERGGGQSLPKDVQRKMSAALGYDFSRVRVHADRQADALSKSLHARAFTTGRDIFFRAGAYQPASAEGQKLLAHELTHVVQQGRGEVPGRGKMSVNPPGDQYEQQAEANAQALAQGAPPQPGHSQAASPLQLQEEEEELIQAQDMFEEDEEMLM